MPKKRDALGIRLVIMIFFKRTPKNLINFFLEIYTQKRQMSMTIKKIVDI